MIFSAAILAGGVSRRMGRDKADIQIGGRALVDLQIEKLWQAGASEVLLSVRSARGQAPRPHCRIVADDRPDCGPLGGLLSCLDRMKTELLLACAVDLPLLNSESFARLVRRATPGCGIVYRNAEGWFEPLLAVYPGSIQTLAEQQLAADEFSLQELLSKAVKDGLMRAEPLPPAQRMRLANLNTPADLARLLIHFPES